MMHVGPELLSPSSRVPMARRRLQRHHLVSSQLCCSPQLPRLSPKSSTFIGRLMVASRTVARLRLER